MHFVTFYISLLLMYWQTFVDDRHMVFASISPPSKVVKRPPLNSPASIAFTIGIFSTFVFGLFIGEDLHVYKGRPRSLGDDNHRFSVQNIEISASVFD